MMRVDFSAVLTEVKEVESISTEKYVRYFIDNEEVLVPQLSIYSEQEDDLLGKLTRYCATLILSHNKNKDRNCN